MNTRLLLKFLFVIAVLFFMVLMGMQNRVPVKFFLLNYESKTLPTAIMYFIFFGAGLLTGGVLALGGHGGGGGKKKPPQ